MDDGWSSLSESIRTGLCCVHSCWLGVEWSCSEMDCVCFNGCVILAVTQALTRPQHHLSAQHTSSRLELLNIHYALSVWMCEVDQINHNMVCFFPLFSSQVKSPQNVMKELCGNKGHEHHPYHLPAFNGLLLLLRGFGIWIKFLKINYNPTQITQHWL